MQSGDRIGGDLMNSRMGQWFAILSCALMVVGAFAVLPSASSRAEAAAPVVLTVGYTQTVDSLNPFVGYLVMSYQVYGLMYEMLVGVDKDLNPTPQIAESWSTSPDGLVWTFNIRHGMTWHDGTPVTAEDVNWTYNLILHDPVAGALSVDYLRNVTDVRAVDDYTLRITTEVPKATMLSIIIPIVPKHLWMNIPSKDLTTVDMFSTTYFPDGPIGSGPFRLVGYALDDFIRFETYDGYYGATMQFDELICKIFLSPQAMLNALYAGSIDVACSVPADSWETTIGKPNIDGQLVRELALWELGINSCPESMRTGGASRNYETLNVSVRQAMAMAINKTDIVKNVLLGLGEEGDVLIPPVSVMWHYNITDAERLDFNIAAANALLDAAGYPKDASGWRYNASNGKYLDFLFEYIVENPEDETAAYLIQAWLAEIGINAPPKGVSESTIIGDWIQMKYDMFIWGWGGDVDPSFLLSVMTTDQIPDSKTDWAAWSDCFYSNPHYDQLFIEQQNTIVMADRQAIVYEMQQIVYHDSPYVILGYPYGAYAYRTDRFTNWPDMASHPGMVPLAGLIGGPLLFFEITPISGNIPPQNVDAGSDTVVALGETRQLTGYAEDPNDPLDTLTWTWEFVENGGTPVMKTGRTVEYTFNNVGTVSVTLTVTDPGGLEGQDSMTVTVVVMEHRGWLAGHVNDTQGNPIEAAQVTVGTTSVTTNKTGYYNMSLVPGTYNGVNASATGYLSLSQSAVIVENETKELDFSLTTSSATLKGHVYDSKTGDPISEVVIRIKMGEASKLGVTNETGYYEITRVEAGTWSVNASKTGYETNLTSVVIVAGEPKVFDINLKPVAGSKGLSTAMLAAITGIIVVVAVVIVALMLMRKKGAAPSTPETKSPEPPKA